MGQERQMRKRGITKKDLERYRNIPAEIKAIEARIQMNRAKLAELCWKNETVVDTVKGGEGGIQHFTIEGFPAGEYDVYSENIRVLNEKLRMRKHHEIELQAEIEEFIAGIDDPVIRAIVDFHYVQGHTWQETAMMTGGNSEGSVKMAFQRFIERHQN